MHWIPAVCTAWCLAITLLAAIVDARTGHIPNALTLPPIVIAPFLWCALGHWNVWHLGPPSFLGSLLWSLACGGAFLAVQYFSRMEESMGWGDIKIAAAIGALLRDVGVEALFFALLTASLFTLGRAAWDGKLFRLLGNTLAIVVNPFRAAHKRRALTPEMLTPVRIGPALFVGTLVAIVSNNAAFGWL